jgi:U1 small nuclear ribonucleoprotein
LDYQAKEKDLEREFGRFGPIERVRIIETYIIFLANFEILQIRIVTDTHQHEKPKKKAKPHRGYAFVVFEREKDMRGKPNYTPILPIHRQHEIALYAQMQSIYTLSFFLFSSPLADIKVYEYW